jgi:hypothetical protein
MRAITVDKKYCFATKAMRKRRAWAERLRRHGFVAAQLAQPKHKSDGINGDVEMSASAENIGAAHRELGPEAAICSLGLSIIDLASPEQTESNCTDDALG